VGHRLHCRIEQADEVAEGITEKAGNAQGHVHPRAVEQAERQDFEIVDPLAAGGPHRSHAHQRHGLGDVIAAGTHGCRAPHRQAELAQVITVVLQVALEDQVGRGEAQAPGGGGGQVAHVHGVEIATGGQHVQAPTAGRATGTGGHETPGQRRQQAMHFSAAAGVQAGGHRFAQRLHHVVYRLPFAQGR